MKILLAGAGGAIGRRLVPLLRAAGHDVVGTTRSADKTAALRALGAEPAVVDVFDAAALTRIVQAALPQVVIHQLTDLPYAPNTPATKRGSIATPACASMVRAIWWPPPRRRGVRRLIAQSIAFVYAPGDGMRVESDPLDLAATGVRKRTVDGVVALEDATLQMPEGIVLRYGLLFGPGTWFEREKRGKPGLHVDAAAQAAVLAVSKGARGIYNIAEDDGAVSSEKAKRELGFDASFRIKP